MIYFIVGASGSGKTACLEGLKNQLPTYQFYDFDDIGVPVDADKKWRQASSEKWLARYLKEKAFHPDVCLCGQMVLGEILACPSAKHLGKIKLCFLDCADKERVARMKKRGDPANQDTLNWASWLRMHHHDPSWRQDVIKSDAWSGLRFDSWDNLLEWGSLADISFIDTTNLSVLKVVEELHKWIKHP